MMLNYSQRMFNCSHSFGWCACVWLEDQNTPKKGCFSAFQLPPEGKFTDGMLKRKRCCVTVSCGDSSLHTRIVEAGRCQTVSSYAWLAVKILRDQLWRVWWRRKRSPIYSSSDWEEEEEAQQVREEAGGRLLRLRWQVFQGLIVGLKATTFWSNWPHWASKLVWALPSKLCTYKPLWILLTPHT